MLLDFLFLMLDSGDSGGDGEETYSQNPDPNETQDPQAQSTDGADDGTNPDGSDETGDQGVSPTNEADDAQGETQQADSEETQQQEQETQQETQDEENTEDGADESEEPNRETQKTFTLDEVRELVKAELASFKEELINGGAFMNRSNQPPEINSLKPGNNYFE